MGKDPKATLSQTQKVLKTLEQAKKEQALLKTARDKIRAEAADLQRRLAMSFDDMHQLTQTLGNNAKAMEQFVDALERAGAPIVEKSQALEMNLRRMVEAEKFYKQVAKTADEKGLAFNDAKSKGVSADKLKTMEKEYEIASKALEKGSNSVWKLSDEIEKELPLKAIQHARDAVDLLPDVMKSFEESLDKLQVRYKEINGLAINTGVRKMIEAAAKASVALKK